MPYKNPKDRKAFIDRWRKGNPEKVAAYARKVRATPNFRKWFRNNRFVVRYGLTLTEYTSMWEAQAGRCWICSISKPLDDGHESLQVDHNHINGKVRGLLCRACNAILGMAGDSEDRLQSAILYLKAFR